MILQEEVEMFLHCRLKAGLVLAGSLESGLCAGAQRLRLEGPMAFPELGGKDPLLASPMALVPQSLIGLGGLRGAW